MNVYLARVLDFLGHTPVPEDEPVVVSYDDWLVREQTLAAIREQLVALQAALDELRELVNEPT